MNLLLSLALAAPLVFAQPAPEQARRERLYQALDARLDWSLLGECVSNGRAVSLAVDASEKTVSLRCRSMAVLKHRFGIINAAVLTREQLAAKELLVTPDGRLSDKTGPVSDEDLSVVAGWFVGRWQQAEAEARAYQSTIDIGRAFDALR